MTIQLKELYLKNFKSWEELHILDFDSKGLCLIYGDNGSGKSSIRQAVEYLLLDRTSDKIPVSDIAKDGDKPCKLYCKLIKDNSVIEIIKYRNDPEHNNKTFLIIDGDDSRTFTDRRATQKEILSVLDIDSDYLFASSVFSNNTLSFIELGDNEKKDILYRILHLDKYNTFFEKASSECKRIMYDIEKMNSSCDNIIDRINDLDEEIEDLKDKNNNFEEIKKNKIDLYRKDIKELESELEEKEIEHDIKNIEIEILEIESSVDRVNTIDIKDNINLIQEELNQIIKIISKKKTEKSSLEKNIENTDHMCPILDIFCNKLEKESDSVKNKYMPLIKELENNIKNLKEEEKNLKNKLKELNDIIDDKSQTHKIVEELSELKEIEYEISRIKDKISNKNDALEEYKNKENDFKDYIDSKNKQKNKLVKEEEKIKNNVAEMVSLYDYYSFWKDGFSKKGIPNLKIESFLSEIENAVNTNLSLMKDRTYVTISSQKQISTGEYREEINYLINHPDKNITNYYSYSGGERHRLKVADLFAFASLFNKFNFLILDEVLELSLDSLGKEEIVELMKNQIEQYGSIFVISHSNSITDSFNDVIGIRKVNGKSKIEEGK